jgi:cobalamin biosynthesis Mg chelatase CobN
MPQVERERVVETEGRLSDGREVKRVVDTARVTETATEARAGTTGQGVSIVLLVSVAACVVAMAAVWYFFFT